MEKKRECPARFPMVGRQLVLSLGLAAFIFTLGPAPSEAKELYEGGTLHKAIAGQWHRASEGNRLATSADLWLVQRPPLI